MPTVELKTEATLANTFNVFGAPSASSALADMSDGTYVECASAFVGEGTYSISDLTVMPPGAVVRQFQAWFRYEPHAAGTTNPDTRIMVDGVWQPIQNPGPATGRVWGTTPAYVGAYSIAQLNGLQVYIDGRVGIGGGAMVTRFFALNITVLWATQPNVVATGPTGTLRINNPTVTWQHYPGTDAVGGQTAYRVRVYDTDDLSTIVYDSGNVAGAAASAVVGPLALEGNTYRAIVNTAQTTNGVEQWSPDSYVTFTLDVSGPTVDVTGPTGVIGTTSPTITWTHTPGAGAQTGQTFYRVRGFAAGDLVTPLYDSGVVAGAATSAKIGPLDSTVSWVVKVATAQTTYGVAQWSPDDSTAFTIDVVPSLIEAVTPTPVPSSGAISLSIVHDDASPPWQWIDVEATYDAGVTWQPVRGATHLNVNGDSWTVVDHEAPNDVPVEYRARASRISVGETITGPWTTSGVVTWHIEGNDVWLKDPADPSKSMKVCISSLPETTHDRAIGVFRPIGAYYPVVVSDVLQAFSAVAGVMTSTAADAAAFFELVKAPVLLAQSPPLPWGWGSRYVALGAVQQGRIGPTSPKAERMWTLTMFEVDRPADPTAT